MALLNSKNVKLQHLAISAALFVSSVVALFLFFYTENFKVSLLGFVVAAVATYSIYYYTVQYFIYRKIKLIYKFIYQTKATPRESFFNDNILPQKSLDEVNKDVQEWASQKRLELERLQLNEQFRKEFLMNLSHELRTPIFTLQGYIESLQSGAAAMNPALQSRFLNNASKGIDRLVRLIDDLDEISKLESKMISLKKENFSILDLIKEVYDEFSLSAQQRKIKLLFKKGADDNLKVHADRAKIRQVLVNLISNSLKYCNENCSLTTGIYLLDGQKVLVEISDDGPGIAEEHLPRLFERFYRADRTLNRSNSGTGLGLAIVKHILEAHGQSINVRSKLAVGTSFGFTLDSNVS